MRGNVLAEVLEENGIAVVHDKTIHDNPSYDASYERSFETVKTLLKKYPSIECIIDLHRDATVAEIAGPVQSVKGKKQRGIFLCTQQYHRNLRAKPCFSGKTQYHCRKPL